jgi:hypothetical protein
VESRRRQLVLLEVVVVGHWFLVVVGPIYWCQQHVVFPCYAGIPVVVRKGIGVVGLVGCG